MNFPRLTIPATGVRRRLGRIISLAALATVVIGVQTASTAAPSAPSSVITVDPARILDTREPIGVPSAAPVGPESSITVQVAGVGGVPANATGVVLTLTAVGATANTFVTATPTGTPRATTSVLNPGVGGAIANTITVGLGTDGKLDLYNGFGSVDLIADVSGYLLPGGATTPHIEYGAIELTGYSGSGNDLATVGAFGCRSLGTKGQLYVDVPLEHGSAVQSVTFRYYDDDGYNMNLALIEINDGTGGPTMVGTLSDNTTASSGTAGYGEVTINPVGGDKVSGDVRYVLFAYVLGKQGGESDLSFCGATVDYAREVG
jgi:hypothetical protein